MNHPPPICPRTRNRPPPVYTAALKRRRTEEGYTNGRDVLHHPHPPPGFVALCDYQQPSCDADRATLSLLAVIGEDGVNRMPRTAWSDAQRREQRECSDLPDLPYVDEDDDDTPEPVSSAGRVYRKPNLEVTVHTYKANAKPQKKQEDAYTAYAGALPDLPFSDEVETSSIPDIETASTSNMHNTGFKSLAGPNGMRDERGDFTLDTITSGNSVLAVGEGAISVAVRIGDVVGSACNVTAVEGGDTRDVGELLHRLLAAGGTVNAMVEMRDLPRWCGQQMDYTVMGVPLEQSLYVRIMTFQIFF